jgi:hypothetical protein
MQARSIVAARRNAFSGYTRFNDRGTGALPFDHGDLSARINGISFSYRLGIEPSRA